jgi:hypothetical protein
LFLRTAAILVILVATVRTGHQYEPAHLATATEQVKPAFADDFESGKLAASNSSFRWRAGTNNVTVSPDISRSGTHSLKFLYRGKPRCRDSTAQQSFQFTSPQTELWLEYYIYLLDGSEGLGTKYTHRIPTKRIREGGGCSSETVPTTNNKLLVLWDEKYNQNHIQFGFELRAMNDTRSNRGLPGDSYLKALWDAHWDESGNQLGFVKPIVTDAAAVGVVKRGRWTRLRFHVKLATDPSVEDGVIRIWIDDRLVLQRRHRAAAQRNYNNYLRHGYLMGWANSGFDTDTPIYIDDFRFFAADPKW